MPPDDLEFARFDWADPTDARGNTWHIAPTGITPAEVEAVNCDTTLPTFAGRSSGRP